MAENKDIEALTFDAVEKDIYVDPPVLPDNIPEEVKLAIWKEWQKEEARRRKAHKISFTKTLKTKTPDFAYQTTLYKHGGVYRQRIGLIGLDGEEDNLEQVIAIPATQDRHFQARGSRGGHKSQNKKRKRRKNKNIKTQKILNQGRKK